jgi:hypothetical protein
MHTKKILLVGGLMALGVTSAFGQDKVASWSGTLADAECKATKVSDACEVTKTTKAFGLVTANGYFMFDMDGNAKVMKALTDAGKADGAVRATITGVAEGKTIKVDAVQI